jgi:hypothetical protein
VGQQGPRWSREAQHEPPSQTAVSRLARLLTTAPSWQAAVAVQVSFANPFALALPATACRPPRRLSFATATSQSLALSPSSRRSPHGLAVAASPWRTDGLAVAAASWTAVAGPSASPAVPPLGLSGPSLQTLLAFAVATPAEASCGSGQLATPRAEPFALALKVSVPQSVAVTSA